MRPMREERYRVIAWARKGELTETGNICMHSLVEMFPISGFAKFAGHVVGKPG